MLTFDNLSELSLDGLADVFRNFDYYGDDDQLTIDRFTFDTILLYYDAINSGKVRLNVNNNDKYWMHLNVLRNHIYYSGLWYRRISNVDEDENIQKFKSVLDWCSNAFSEYEKELRESKKSSEEVESKFKKVDKKVEQSIEATLKRRSSKSNIF